MVHVFQPQLEETLVEACARSFAEGDAFQQASTWASVAPRPVFKGTIAFFDAVQAFCRMLDEIPQDQAFSRLILTQLITYYDRCFGWYNGLMSRSRSTTETEWSLKFSAAHAEGGEVHDTVAALLGSANETKGALLERETFLLASTGSIDAVDLLSDRRSTASLCMLHTSMRWIANRLLRLRDVTDCASDSTRIGLVEQNLQHRWISSLSPSHRDDNTPVYLPLDTETAEQFDGVVSSYQELARVALEVLHLDMRAHVLFGIQTSFKGTYMLSHPINEAEHGVLSLNADLTSFDEELTAHLDKKSHRFVATGLGMLLDEMIVRNARRLCPMNEHGARRMQRNILVLQQNLKNIEPSAVLSRSCRFFDLFLEGAKNMLKNITIEGRRMELEEMRFGQRELGILLELCWSAELANGDNAAKLAANEKLEENLAELERILSSKSSKEGKSYQLHGSRTLLRVLVTDGPQEQS